MSKHSEALQVISRIVQVFDDLHVAYLIGGSVASSALGTFRLTNDVDFVADLKQEHIAAFVAALEIDFYADAQTIRKAIAARRSFNVIYLKTMFKADIFPLNSDDWSQEQMRRRKPEPLTPEPDGPQAYVCSAEDIILQKLRWFRKSNEVLTEQLKDIRGVLRVQRETLDYDYLNQWAGVLGVADLLAPLLAELDEKTESARETSNHEK